MKLYSFSGNKLQIQVLLIQKAANGRESFGTHKI